MTKSCWVFWGKDLCC